MKKSLFGVKKATSTIRANVFSIATANTNGANAKTEFRKIN